MYSVRGKSDRLLTIDRFQYIYVPGRVNAFVSLKRTSHRTLNLVRLSVKFITRILLLRRRFVSSKRFDFSKYNILRTCTRTLLYSVIVVLNFIPRQINRY